MLWPARLSFIIFVLALVINVMLQVLIEYSLNSSESEYNPEDVLIDIGFILVPEINVFAIKVIILYAPWILFLVTFIILVIYQTTKTISLFLLILTFVMILRAISISITIFPNPYPSCNFTSLQPTTGPKMFGPFLYDCYSVLIGINETCKDAFFSGHTAFVGTCLTVIYLLIKRTAGERNQKERTYQFIMIEFMVIYGPLMILYGIFVIGIRLHYTLDVIVGALFPVIVLHFILKKSNNYIF